MTWFDPVTHPDDVEDTEPPDPAVLTVDYVEPSVVARLLAPNGEPLIELMDREPPGFRRSE